MTNPATLCSNLSINAQGHLCFRGHDTLDLAAEYGTPLYLLDADRVRENCRIYLDTFLECFPAGSKPLFASKALSFTGIYRIMKELGMGIDVVSSGEIHTARNAGFDLSQAFFHSNNKTDEDISFAMDAGVGYFVVDNPEELLAIQAEAERRGIRQKVLLRLTPGIDTHTYEAVNTGKVDSKFGQAIETGQADAFTSLALAQPSLELKGFHCHVGSQVFTEDVFERAAEIMLRFIAHIRQTSGYSPAYLNLGGGYGVRYIEDDPHIDIPRKIRDVAAAVNKTCAELNIPVPAILMEPGRSIVADAGLTLYTAGSVKTIPGYRTYVAVDGGMSDNPRYALYGARYTCYNAGRMTVPYEMECSLVGRCCESGDIIQPFLRLPAETGRGDIMAVCTTGAYNYSMASNYNRIPRPPIVMLREGSHALAVRREQLADLTALDL
ncbi:MAG: diaminopimelate decarboxylase [Oscillospiraceae bacterium]|nr:diaminopimelate decarboxylase [Oscillospiraceae bacterium]